MGGVGVITGVVKRVSGKSGKSIDAMLRELALSGLLESWIMTVAGLFGPMYSGSL
jgi:hypothetical protein